MCALPHYWPEDGWIERPGYLLSISNYEVYYKITAQAVITKVQDNRVTKTDIDIRNIRLFSTQLAPASPFYKIISSYINWSVINRPYKTARFEAARLATNDEINKKTIKKYFSSDLEIDEFKDSAYAISRIEILYSPILWRNYFREKQKYPFDAAVQQRLEQVDWAGKNSWTLDEIYSDDRTLITFRNDVFPFPFIVNSITNPTNEVFQFHGTDSGAFYPILTNGFDPGRSSIRPWPSYYGSLGQGVYLTDNLAKSASYTKCPGCNTRGRPCGCLGANNLPLERFAFIVRTMSGAGIKYTKQKLISRKQYAASDPNRYPIYVGRTGTGSEWPNNVFLVRQADLLYPEFAVYFMWPKGGFNANQIEALKRKGIDVQMNEGDKGELSA